MSTTAKCRRKCRWARERNSANWVGKSYPGGRLVRIISDSETKIYLFLKVNKMGSQFDFIACWFRHVTNQILDLAKKRLFPSKLGKSLATCRESAKIK
jgi:hypothetical protein